MHNIITASEERNGTMEYDAKMKIVSKVMRLSSDILEDLEYCEEDEYGGVYSCIAEMTGASQYEWGRSKLVLEYSDIPDYVIKIPIRRCVDLDGCSYVYENAFLRDGETRLEDTSDYCRIEAKEYRRACDAGIGSMFAGTWKLCDIDDMPIYISEKVVKTFDEIESIEEIGIESHEWEWIKCKCKEHDIDINRFSYNAVIDALIQKYDINKVIEFNNFLHADGIMDLHTGNIGVDKNGDIKIIDYPGFFD